MRTITFKCPDKLAIQLEREISNRNIQKSDLLRTALIYYLARKGVATKKASLYSLSQDLCGAVDAPEDLSENPDHFEGYGK